MASEAIVMAASAAHLGAASELRDIATDDTASSECIGEPRTPQCALDTWIACFMWAEPSLCEKVGLRGTEFNTNTGEWPTTAVSYQVYEALDIEARHLTHLPSDQTSFRPGYIDLRYSYCDYEDRDRCTAFGAGNVLILKPVGQEWHVSGWLIEVGDVACENYSWERDYPPSEHECQLNISTWEFNRYEASRAQAE